MTAGTTVARDATKIAAASVAAGVGFTLLMALLGLYGHSRANSLRTFTFTPQSVFSVRETDGEVEREVFLAMGGKTVLRLRDADRSLFDRSIGKPLCVTSMGFNLPVLNTWPDVVGARQGPCPE